MNNDGTRYEVALSFAGEQREYVEDVALHLQSRGIAVFYDNFELSDLWGRNLSEELHDVYENRSNFVVMFISDEYVEKAWPQHERRAILSRAIRQRREYILPVRFDNTDVPGMASDVMYLSAADYVPAALATMIAKKLGMKAFDGKASDAPPPRMTALAGEAVFDYSNHNGKYVIGRDQFSFETKWSKASDREIYVYNDPPSINGVAIAREHRSIFSITNARELDFTSRSRTPRREEIVVFRNDQGFYAAAQILELKDDTRGADRDELRFIYVVQEDGTDNFAALANRLAGDRKAETAQQIVNRRRKMSELRDILGDKSLAEEERQEHELSLTKAGENLHKIADAMIDMTTCPVRESAPVIWITDDDELYVRPRIGQEKLAPEGREAELVSWEELQELLSRLRSVDQRIMELRDREAQVREEMGR